MLVSVGTLLYITTMHMLPEVYSMHGGHHIHDHSNNLDQDNDFELKPAKENWESSRVTKLITLVLGLNAAFLLTLVH
jgi:hypothetical protein